MHPTVPRGVIVADDSPIIRDNVRGALGEAWRVFLAADGAEAVEYARNINAELVLLDFNMPRRDGLDACAAIRTMPNYASVPIVLLTAYDSGELRRRAAKAGATAVFAKPFTIDELREAVLPLIWRGRASAAGSAGAGLGDVAAADAAGLAADRNVLAVHRKVDQAAEHRRLGGSFVEAIATLRTKLQR
ncbi:MAG TPA: response regulator [Acetobacteraceae bacterium]|nr:response regulator [Acetobacteraceae bacterium]